MAHYELIGTGMFKRAIKSPELSIPSSGLAWGKFGDSKNRVWMVQEIGGTHEYRLFGFNPDSLRSEMQYPLDTVIATDMEPDTQLSLHRGTMFFSAKGNVYGIRSGGHIGRVFSASIDPETERCISSQVWVTPDNGNLIFYLSWRKGDEYHRKVSVIVNGKENPIYQQEPTEDASELMDVRVAVSPSGNFYLAQIERGKPGSTRYAKPAYLTLDCFLSSDGSEKETTVDRMPLLGNRGTILDMEVNHNPERRDGPEEELWMSVGPYYDRKNSYCLLAMDPHNAEGVVAVDIPERRLLKQDPRHQRLLLLMNQSMGRIYLAGGTPPGYTTAGSFPHVIQYGITKPKKS